MNIGMFYWQARWSYLENRQVKNKNNYVPNYRNRIYIRLHESCDLEENPASRILFAVMRFLPSALPFNSRHPRHILQAVSRQEMVTDHQLSLNC